MSFTSPKEEVLCAGRSEKHGWFTADLQYDLSKLYKPIVSAFLCVK